MRQFGRAEPSYLAALATGLLICAACRSSGPDGFDPSDAASREYELAPDGGLFTVGEGGALRDSADFVVQLDGRAVGDAPVRFRATRGKFGNLSTQTDVLSKSSDQEGRVGYVWFILASQRIPGDSAVIFGCVQVDTECSEFRLTGYPF